MSRGDAFEEPVESALAGRTLTEFFAELPRGDIRPGVAGKVHDPERLRADAAFEPRRIPVFEITLREEGLSDSFVTSMRNWPGFVAD